ncbi:MAG: hypothetical protein J6R73_07150, partial [Alistipes sp.]|nr:hypothetical protein [Alistipes sp.]
RRWLLFDGGTGFAAIGAKALTGWGGNTCTYLGFKPFNGQRRNNMEFQVKPSINGGVGGKEWKVGDLNNTPDPIAQKYMADNNCDYATFQKWRDGFKYDVNGKARHGNNNAMDNALINLKTNFYEPYLQRKDKKGDALTSDNTTDGMTISYLARYYFLGLTSSVQAKNPLILQTVGWEDHYNRGEFFDPAE